MTRHRKRLLLAVGISVATGTFLGNLLSKYFLLNQQIYSIHNVLSIFIMLAISVFMLRIYMIIHNVRTKRKNGEAGKKVDQEYYL